jgi:hypothetical protein
MDSFGAQCSSEIAQPKKQAHNWYMITEEDPAMNTRTDNTQNTVEEFRQAAKRLGDGAAYVAREVPWAALVKGTFKLAINILRYSMGIAIYGLIIWPYRLLVAPTCAVAAGMAEAQADVDDDDNVDIFGNPLAVDMFGNPVEVDMFGNPTNPNDHPMFPTYIDNQTGQFTLSSHNSYEYDEKEWWV